MSTSRTCLTPRQTHYVPGHGDVADVKDVEEFRAYLLDLERLVSEARKARAQGRCPGTGRRAETEGAPPRLDDQRSRRGGRDPLHGPGTRWDEEAADPTARLTGHFLFRAIIARV